MDSSGNGKGGTLLQSRDPSDSAPHRVVSLAVMDTRRSVGRLVLAGAAFAGVILGHWLSYLIALPDAHQRTVALASAGHGYWVSAVKLAVTCAVVAVASEAIRRTRAALGRDSAP